MEVVYPPGIGSPPHVHANGVMAFVVSGSIASKVGDEPERVFHAGEAWWEPVGAVHRVSRNASQWWKCSNGNNLELRAFSQVDSSKSGTATVSVLAPHPIGVRPTTSGIAEFYDVATGNAFTPRGNNYIRLAWQTNPSGQQYYHSTFNVGLYDATRAETALLGMQSSGYNIVRVFLNGCCINSIGNPAGGSRPTTSPTWPIS